MQRSPGAIGWGVASSLLSCHIRHLTLASTSALGSLECMVRLSHATTHSEALSALENYRQVQMEILNCHANYTRDLAYELAQQAAKHFRNQAIVTSGVIL